MEKREVRRTGAMKETKTDLMTEVKRNEVKSTRSLINLNLSFCNVKAADLIQYVDDVLMCHDSSDVTRPIKTCNSSFTLDSQV